MSLPDKVHLWVQSFRGVPSQRGVSVGCSPSGVSLPWHTLPPWAEIPCGDIASENASGCAASTALWAAHLHLCPQSGTSSHRLPVHLLPPAACRDSISGLELGRCQLTCLTAALPLCVLSPTLKVSGLACDWHVAGCGLALHSSPLQNISLFRNVWKYKNSL